MGKVYTKRKKQKLFFVVLRNVEPNKIKDQ